MKELLKELIKAESTPEQGELAAAEVIAVELGRSGINARIDSWDSARANVVAHIMTPACSRLASTGRSPACPKHRTEEVRS